MRRWFSRAGGSAAALLWTATMHGAAGPTPLPTCTETVSEDGRPKVKERFPEKASIGYAVMLDVEIEHGKGQSILPGGFRLQREGPAVQALEARGFALPSSEGTAVPQLESKESGAMVRTTVKIPFVVLPKKAGRQTLTLPPVPIAIARASGDIVTLCTSPHEIVVEEPTANVPVPEPKANPPLRRQLEEWMLPKILLLGALGAALAALALVFVVRWWLRRPARPKPIVPERPPWELALQALLELNSRGLVASGHKREHLARAADILRVYLGARYGFDGLECTSEEVLRHLSRKGGKIATEAVVREVLSEADLVKFAKAEATAEGCERVVELVERVVRETIPAASPEHQHAGALPGRERSS